MIGNYYNLGVVNEIKEKYKEEIESK